MDTDQREFGQERFERLIMDHRQESAGEILAALEHALADFNGSTAPYDDITLLIVKRLVD
jgi:serine phosphatase RsbU (regulator of sigma subunit)